jgi:hypothetical protein
MNANQILAQGLRVVAEELRKEAAAVRQRRTIKCAKILTAARGLSQLKRILKGEER